MDRSLCTALLVAALAAGGPAAAALQDLVAAPAPVRAAAQGSGVREVTAPGDVVVDLAAGGRGDGAVQVRVRDGEDVWWLDHRAAPAPGETAGVQVRHTGAGSAPPAAGAPRLVLVRGEAWTSPAGTVRLTLLAADGDGARVRVEAATSPLPATTAPATTAPATTAAPATAPPTAPATTPPATATADPTTAAGPDVASVPVTAEPSPDPVAEPDEEPGTPAPGDPAARPATTLTALTAVPSVEVGKAYAVTGLLATRGGMTLKGAAVTLQAAPLGSTAFGDVRTVRTNGTGLAVFSGLRASTSAVVLRLVAAAQPAALVPEPVVSDVVRMAVTAPVVLGRPPALRPGVAGLLPVRTTAERPPSLQLQSRRLDAKGRPAGDGAWTAADVPAVLVDRARGDHAVRLVLPAGTWEVRVARTGDASLLGSTSKAVKVTVRA